MNDRPKVVPNTTSDGAPVPRTREAREEQADARLRESTAAAFVIRRPLDRSGVGTAVAAGVVAGMLTAYLTAIWVARAPLDVAAAPRRPRRRG